MFYIKIVLGCGNYVAHINTDFSQFVLFLYKCYEYLNHLVLDYIKNV